MTRGVSDHMIGNPRKPRQQTSGRLVRKPAQSLRGGQKHFLEDVVNFYTTSQRFTHLVVHQDRKSSLIFPKEQAECSLFTPLEPFDQVTRRRLSMHWVLEPRR
jgi:hypothetical protein